MDTVLAEQSPKKILEIKAEDANIEEEMPHLMLCGTDSGTRKSPTRNGSRWGYSATTTACTTSLQENSSNDPPTPQGQSLNLMNKSLIILQSMGQSIHIVDHNGLIVYWNPAAERLFGYSKSEALGLSPLDLIIDECDYNKATEIICRSSIGQVWTGRFPVTTKYGRRFLGFGTTTPLYDDCGVFIGVICISLDSQPYYEAQTLYSSRSYLPLEPAYPSSSEPCPTITSGLDSQEKDFHVATASKVLNLTSRMITKVWTKVTACKKTMGQDTHGSLETVWSDDREEEILSPGEQLRGSSNEGGEGKFGICKMIIYSVMGMLLLPWKGREQDGSIKRTTTTTTTHCAFLSLSKMSSCNKRG